MRACSTDARSKPRTEVNCNANSVGWPKLQENARYDTSCSASTLIHGAVYEASTPDGWTVCSRRLLGRRNNGSRSGSVPALHDESNLANGFEQPSGSGGQHYRSSSHEVARDTNVEIRFHGRRLLDIPVWPHRQIPRLSISRRASGGAC